ncbi:hypothetical protein [Cobetia marina]|uniref:hypothetical protein n=1 Tax=Cobetia marina TaxID=28258 RepID=UPI00174A0041
MRLYRGFSYAESLSDGILINSYRDAPRQPVDTPIFIHKIVDEWFFNNFRVKARSECIFCTPDVSEATKYSAGYSSGVLAEVFFGGESKFLYSASVVDLNMYVYDIGPDKEDIFDWLDAQEYKMVYSPDDIPDDVVSEIMVDCKKYEISILKRWSL